MSDLDPFVDADGQPRRLSGAAIYSGSARLAELAILCGFETVWIEMEHGPTSLQQAEAICTAVESAGGVPLIRVAGYQRPHVLGALEVGAGIVLVPMVNTAAQAREIVTHGKFPPLGKRGFNNRTRGNRYGSYDSATELMSASNHRTHLFAQIETVVATQNLSEICAVDGLSGIFVGPSDLSVDLGIPGQLSSTSLIDTAIRCIQSAREAGKHAGILAAPGPLLEAAMDAGADLVIIGGDMADLSAVWRELTDQVTSHFGSR